MTNPEKKSKKQFKEHAETAIWNEKPSTSNPYIAQNCYLHGYDLAKLIKSRSFIDVLFLMFKSELPSTSQAHLLETLMIACINPGPRHPATRAAMNAGVSKTNFEHILPIGLMTLGGAYNGSTEVEQAINFLAENKAKNPNQLAKKLLIQNRPKKSGDWHIAPGFGSYYGGINIMASELANYLLQLPEVGESFKWADSFVSSIQETKPLGWLHTGIVAAILADLGFGAREGAGLYQIMSAPGILAHGLEQTHKPIFAMPLLEDKNYVIQTKK
ncbi:MAG: citrate synthase [Pseudomonadota bacterium]